MLALSAARFAPMMASRFFFFSFSGVNFAYTTGEMKHVKIDTRMTALFIPSEIIPICDETVAATIAKLNVEVSNTPDPMASRHENHFFSHKLGSIRVKKIKPNTIGISTKILEFPSNETKSNSTPTITKKIGIKKQ